MSSEKALSFLTKYEMGPETVRPAEMAPEMTREMERGLRGEGGSLAMIPTYLSDHGQLPLDQPVAVIDAGGTNFRRALVSFTENGVREEELKKWRMPGIERPTSWDEFIRFTADAVEPLMDRTDKIGFCFSYSAEITPDMDGRVLRIDKEVVIEGCEGRLVGASLLGELERRGIRGKKIVILNDTVAVQLGGLAQKGSDGVNVIGQVSGTGTNTCCALPEKRIPKLGRDRDRRMIVNLESGMYDGIRGGYFDRKLDQESHNPGQKHFEKLTAGVYLGELCHLMLLKAAEEGLLCPKSAEKVRALGHIDSAVIEAWSMGEKMDQIADGEDDAAFVRDICRAVFERSARLMCLNLAAIVLLTGEKKLAVCAEGSLVQKGRYYQAALTRLIDEEICGKLGRKLSLRIGDESTLSGSAAAALLNL